MLNASTERHVELVPSRGFEMESMLRKFDILVCSVGVRNMWFC